MGLSKTIYLGPYLRCETRTEEAVTAVRGCPAPDCSDYNKWAPTGFKFCPLCGAHIRPVRGKVVAVTPDPDPVELFGEVGEVLVPLHRRSNGAFTGPAGAHYWVNNRRDCPPRRFDLSHGEHLVEIAAEEREAEMRAFAEFHEEAIAKLRAAYGARPTLKWGLIVYTS